MLFLAIPLRRKITVPLLLPPLPLVHFTGHLGASPSTLASLRMERGLGLRDHPGGTLLVTHIRAAIGGWDRR